MSDDYDMEHWLSEYKIHDMRVPVLAQMWVAGYSLAQLVKIERRRFPVLNISNLKLARDIMQHWEHERSWPAYVLAERGERDNCGGMPRLTPHIRTLKITHDLSDLHQRRF